MSSSSSSTASGSASWAVVAAPRSATFSDLLVQSGTIRHADENVEKTTNKKKTTGLEYNEWISALQDANSRNFEKQVVAAKVNAWQFSIFRGRRTSATLPKRLPEDVVGLVQKFIGPAATAKLQTVPNLRSELERLSDVERARGYKRVVEYFLKLAREVAAKGGSILEISQATHEAAPKMSDGSTADIRPVFEVLEAKGYKVRDARGWYREHVDFRTDGYPHRLEFNFDVDSATYMRELVDELEGGRASMNSSDQVSSDGVNSKFAKIFVDSLLKVEDAAYQYVINLVEENLARSSFRFVLTDEIYQGAPKLPDGGDYPMFPRDVSEVSGGECDTRTIGLYNRLWKTKGLNVYCRNAQSFPIYIEVMMGSM
ncbi:unnamed protein product [Amoebophrya sp. A120]|nr:unnamed protein product [Amoebophrya sp. A120]|eukprot:GSA120T00005262001.1